MRLINAGFGTLIPDTNIVVIVEPNSAPIKRLIEKAKENNKLIDCTYGRRTRSVIVTNNDYVILSAVQAETLGKRYNEGNASSLS